MDQKGRGRGRGGGGGGGGGGGAGGRGGGDNSRTDLLAAGRKKLQQFRKKKEKKGPGKKAEAEAADEGASQAGANGEEAVPEPKSPVGLKFLAGEGGSSSRSTPFEEAARVQEEQCNGQGPATTEPSAAENADVVPVLEDADGGSVQNISSISEHGNSEHGSPEPVDDEDSTVQAISSDVGGDLVGAQPGEVDGEELLDCISKESTEPQVSSQDDVAEDGSNKVGEHQEVQMDPVERSNSSDFKEIKEAPIPSQDSVADNTNIGEGAREMDMGVSGRPSDDSIQEDVEPTVSAEIGVEAGHEEALALVASHEIPGRGDTDGEADGMGKEAVQEDVGKNKTNAIEEAATAYELDLSVENVDPALFGGAVSQGFMPYHHEYVQSYLYATTISRDFLQLQLDEVAHLNSGEILKLQVLLKESEESKVAVCDEIQQCRHELSDMNAVKGELELIVASQKQEISAGNSKCEQLEIELQSSKENAQQILSELADCQSLLEALRKENMELTTNLALEKESRKEVEEQGEHLSGENKKLLSNLSDLELSLASVKEVMNAGSSRCESLELELCSSKDNMEQTLTELANCRALLETSQKDYFELSAKFAVETEANMKLKEDNVYLHNEKEKLSSDLSELNDKLHVSYAKHEQLESHVRDMETQMEQLKEQLIEESMHATNSFDIYQSVIKELDAKCNVVLDQAQTVVCRKNEHHPDSSEITVENVERTLTSSEFVSDGNNQHSHTLFNEKDSCKSTALQSLKGHLEVAKGELYELQKLVERISSRSDGRVLISKLIQSFEVKGNQEEPGMSEGEHDDLKKLTQEMISCLMEKFKLMTSDLTKTEKYVAELCDRIELSSKSEVEQEAERQHTADFEVKMDGLVEKLGNYKNTIDQLNIQLADVQQDADNHAGKLTDQAELLHNDVTERISILEKERASLSDLLSEVTNKLSSLSGTSPNDLGDSEGLSFYILDSVDLAAKSIQSLQDKLEAGQTDNAKLNTSLSEIMKAHSDVQGRNEHACRMVKSMYDSLQEFLHGSLGYSDEAGAGYNAEEPIEALLSHLGATIEHLKNLLHDHHSLQSNNVSLESRLLSKCEEVEELSLRCSSLTKNMNDICLQNEELKLVSSSKSASQDEMHGRCLSIAEKMVHHSANPTSVVLPSMSSGGEAETLSKEHHILTTLLPCIEEGVASYNEKLENAVEETRLSKICLQNAHIFDQILFDKWSLPLPVLIKEEIVPLVCDLQGKIDQLSALNIQFETEVPVLRDGLKKLDEALEISRTDLQKRSSEHEQSEQKLSSVKEKLGIAVAKGKGLIVQRDGLKQSLSEKSGELEKLSQELQSKDALVKELEAKLKSYAEADRIEALESELSYIRNSATALRDSFILKDSVLQRIEEVLEDLDLPDRFHSRDIVEKIELLSKMAVGASFTMPDGDKRSSVDGHSESGAAMDGVSDEQISNSNPGSDEMKNKYEELHRRFYELAEHNNMLEQSLVERNSIVQKWEEVLGQVSIPPQFRMLEPEDRIAWLGNRLLEVEHERDALHLKIEHLEDSSEMLITDLEESHKRISELSAEVVAVKAEKEFFSQSLEKLRFEFLGLSEKAVQDEFVRDNLQKDLAELQEKLAENANGSKRYHDLEIEIHKLLDMVRNVLQDGSNTEIPSGDSGAVLCLGELLRKVLHHYETLLSASTLGSSADKEIHLEEAMLSNDASTSETGRDDKESALNALSNELEHARRSLTLAEQQCEEAVEKAQSLTLEVEMLHSRINQLQEVGAEQTQKYQSLVLELESVCKQRDDLQEELNQSNELEHARSSLVLAEQQRDEAVEKSHSLILEVEAAHAQLNLLQEGGAEQTKKYESLVLELELVGKQRDDLQEKLNQEEQKCASLREKLNVAVRKGKGLVQQRDNLKQTIEETNAVIENLKNERKQHIESLESEKSLLMGRLSENEKSLHDTTQYLSRLLNALSMVDIAREFNTDPITKVGKIAQLYLDLQATAASLQNEVKKSKRATELLLAELNEAHERADNLQEELMMAEAALSESSKQNNVLESARADAVRHLEHITYMQAQAARKQIDHLKELNSTSGQLREVCFELSHRLVSAFSKDVDLICYMESFMKSSGKWMDGTNMVDIPITSNRLLSTSISSKKALIPNAPLEFTVDDTDGSQLLHHLAIACHAVSDCVKDCNDLKRNIDEHGFSIDQKATELSGIMSNLQSRFTSQNNELESLKEHIVELQSEIKEKEEESLSMRRNMSLLYEACSTSVSEIEEMTGMGSGNRSYSVGQNHLSSDDHIKSVVEQLGAAVKTTRYSSEGNTKELKATVLELQQELQGKDVQISTISSELASQIREGESYAKQLSVELEDARMEIHNLEKHVEMLLNQKKALETQVSELKDLETVASEQHGRIKKLTDELSRKDQEIEGLMQALDEEEKELEILENKGNGLEQMLQEKEFALKSLEVSRTKTLTKLATTVDKFDELHSLSESLLVEVESLQSQLQERDSEISFLRQEVTRSTNELLTTEDSNKQYSSQINDFVKWLETALLQFGVHCENTYDHDCTQVPVYMDMLDKKIGSLISESDDLRIAVQSKDSSLQVERTKMEELSRKSEALEASLSQKDSQIGLLRRDRISGQPSRSINLPGTSEIEQMNDKVSPTAVGTQIRGARKVNNDQVAIDVEMQKDKPLDDEDDDKAHGFKSLTMSRIVPKFTRPISDRVDGMWVSGDRLLMRQPTLRLGVLLYWIALHALLASFI